MHWEKVKIIKTVLSLVLALGVSVFIGEKVFFPGTMIINPRVKIAFISLPGRIKQSSSNFVSFIKQFASGSKLSKSPPSANQPPWTFFPTWTYPLQPTVPGYNPPYSSSTATPAPQASSSPYQPGPTATPRPTGGQTPNPTSTPVPTATPIVPTPTISSVSVETFARCLTERGMKMYGTDTCGACRTQKNFFGAAFSYITYINCGTQAQVCQSRGIGYYPTWEDGSGNLHPGGQSFPSLSQMSGCPAPN